MPGFPDKFMPFMDEPFGARLSTPVATYLWGPVLRSMRRMTTRKLDAEPQWRHTGAEITTGYQPQTW